MAARAPPSSFNDSESSSDESSLSSGDESSDDEEDVAPTPIEAKPAAVAAPVDEPATAAKPAPTVAASPPRKQRKVDPEKLTLYLLAAGWTKVSINHQSNWLDTFGVAYSSSRAILSAYPELYDHCA
ncbi:hypothetical protein JL721_560 [Aureococcus anophagefferens]|nr:hypothetical protein JL721_560 [Aureococcus anophagefferens]